MKSCSIFLLLIMFASQIYCQEIVWDFNLNNTTALNYSIATISALSLGNSNGTVATPLSTIATSSGAYTGASGGYNYCQAARSGALNTGVNGSAYYEFTITPPAGYTLLFNFVSFGTRITSLGPLAYSIRNSTDNYATELLGINGVAAISTWQRSVLSPFSPLYVSSQTTFRLYGYNGTGSPAANSITWRIDDLELYFNTIILPVTAVNIVNSGNTGNGTVSWTLPATYNSTANDVSFL